MLTIQTLIVEIPSALVTATRWAPTLTIRLWCYMKQSTVWEWVKFSLFSTKAFASHSAATKKTLWKKIIIFMLSALVNNFFLPHRRRPLVHSFVCWWGRLLFLCTTFFLFSAAALHPHILDTSNVALSRRLTMSRSQNKNNNVVWRWNGWRLRVSWVRNCETFGGCWSSIWEFFMFFFRW